MKRLIAILIACASLCYGQSNINITFTQSGGINYANVTLTQVDGKWYALPTVASSPATLPTPYLWWKMDDQVISTNIFDASTNAYNFHLTYGADTEALFSKDRPSQITNGYSYYCNTYSSQSSPLIREDSDLLRCTNTDFTIGIWYKLISQHVNGGQGLMFKGVTANYWGITDWDNGVWHINALGGNQSVACAKMNISGWTHIACVYDKASAIVTTYSNGIQIASASLGAIPSSTANMQLLGTGWASQYADGRISQPYMTHSKVSSNDVYTWYTSGVVPTNTAIFNLPMASNYYRYADSGTNLNWHGLRLDGATASNNALYFDGVNDSASVWVNTNAIDTAWTKSFWLNAVDYKSGDLSAIYASGYNIRFGGTYGDGTFNANSIAVFLINNTAISQTPAGAVPTTLTNQWINFVCTYNATNIPRITLYMQGTNVPLATTNFVASQGSILTEKIGMGNSSWHWHGLIDDVKQDAYAWSPDMVMSNYAAGRN